MSKTQKKVVKEKKTVGKVDRNVKDRESGARTELLRLLEIWSDYASPLARWMHIGPSDMLEQWRDYQLLLLKQMNASMGVQQQVYASLWDKWMTFSTDTYKNLATMTSGHGKKYSEIYDLWDEYYEKLNSKMQEITQKNTSEYFDALERWNEMVDLIEKVLRLPRGESSERVNDIQDKYQEFADYIANKTSERAVDTISEYHEIEDIWTDFTKKMKKMQADIEMDDESFKKISVAWEKVAREMSMEINNFIQSSTDQWNRSQEVWNAIASTMMKSAEPFFSGKEKE